MNYDFNINFAKRANCLSTSEVRALFQVATNPKIISLAGGMPYIDALDKDILQECLYRAALKSNTSLQYGSGNGIDYFRQQITDIVSLENINANADDIIITTGSQQGMDLIAGLFIDPGDVIIAESPSYVGAIGIFRSYQAEIVHTLCDDEGIVPSYLEELIYRLKHAGKTIKLLYTIPNFHNPTGICLSQKRRPEILDICNTNNITILEDNPYGLLWFDKRGPDPLKTLDDNVIYLGSFSKIFAPGFRVGYIIPPKQILPKLILANESATLSPTTFGQVAISEYLKLTDLNSQIQIYRDIYKSRCNAMKNALQKNLPHLYHSDPKGGFYIWLKIPDRLNSRSLLNKAIENKVAYTPGTAFFADGTGENYIRLSFCYPIETEITEGIYRLSKTIKDY